jgi:replicative DNA helicase
MFQQEMTDVQLGLREIALKSGLSTQDLRRGRISDGDYEGFSKAVGSIERSNVFVDVSVGQTLASIRAKTQRAIDEHGIKFVVIDYLNLCDLEVKKHGNEEQAIAHHAKSMKAMAKEFNIAVLELVQFNKEASKEPLKPPTMAMLKGSGAIEFSADFVGLFWNPAKFDESFVYEDGTVTKDKIAIIVAKNKNGDTGMFWHGVKPYNNQFFELENNDYEPNKHIEANIDFDNEEKPNF